MYDPATSVFYLKDTHTSGGPDHAISFAPKQAGALPLAGDWIDNGLSAIGLYDPASGEIRLRQTLTAGPPENVQTFVPGLEQVFSGRWNATKHAPGGKPKVKRSSVPAHQIDPEALGGDSDPGTSPSPVHLNLGKPAGVQAMPPNSTRPNATSSPLAKQTLPPTWNYTVRDENNRPSIQYHLGPNGALITDRLYAYLGDRLIATYEAQPLEGTPQWVYHTTDHLGSVSLEGTTQGNRTHNYWPFGEEIPQSTATQESLALRFAAMERDPASQNDYDHARYCSALQGRFLGPDKLQGRVRDPQTWNRYVYARNNPIKYFDPNGEDFDTYIAGIVDAVGSNIVFGIGRGQSTDHDFQLGQRVGDVISVAQGGAEVVVGGGGEVLGVSLDLTGVGAVVGVPVNVASAGVILHGAGVSASGIIHLAQNMDSAPKESAGGPGAGKRFSEGTKKAERERNPNCVYCGKPTTDKPGPNQSNIDHRVPKSKGGNNTPPNANNSCRTCNLKKGVEAVFEFLRRVYAGN